MQMAAQEIRAKEALELLKGWFNNKMMVVIFRIQCVHIYVKKWRRPIRESRSFS